MIRVGSVPVIHIREEDIQKMIRHSETESPKEACGILAGRVDGDRIQVTQVLECENVHSNPTVEFFIKPEDQLRVFLEVEKTEDLVVVGFYHSHPRGPSSPSQIDAAKNYWPDHPMAIISLLPEPEVSFWEWADGTYRSLDAVRERF